ncbi:N-acetylmuramoyl-L-alanine amidase [Mobilicoccus sp.]|uniref:N-acetylmuramoyl-L-alanine amidase n=1 Tax=Mobilicoccus sp. TaxID=2034349 RepID=UPI00289BE14D|nr:N-acetylmuramoyl-L-alanine amidase [Mobilicoccus sp.]
MIRRPALAAIAAAVLTPVGASGLAPLPPASAAPTTTTHAVTPSVLAASPTSLAAVPTSRAARSVPSRGGVRLSPTGTGPLAGRIVVVDPGHNGVYDRRVNTRLVPAGNGARKACNTSGTANSRLTEHALNWAVASDLARQLRAKGATVVLTRPNDRGVGPCVNERAAIGNRARADLVVSIHADGNTSRRARGFHVITSPTMKGGRAASARSERLALGVAAGMRRAGMPRSTYLGDRRGIDVRRDIAGLNLSVPPAVMLEMGNMRHPSDAALFDRPTFRRQVARGLTDAVVATLR